jgi:hypothetical protein
MAKLSKGRHGNRADEYRRSLEKTDHVIRAVEMRIAGATLPQIAKQLGFSVGAVHGWCNDYLAEWREKAANLVDEGRMLGISAMDRVIMQENQVIVGLTKKAFAGDVKAAQALARSHEILIKAHRRRSAYTGSDLPKEVKQKVTVDAVAPIVITLADMNELLKTAIANEKDVAPQTEDGGIQVKGNFGPSN